MTAEQIMLDLFEPRHGMDLGGALANLELNGFKVVPLDAPSPYPSWDFINIPDSVELGIPVTVGTDDGETWPLVTTEDFDRAIWMVRAMGNNDEINSRLATLEAFRARVAAAQTEARS